MSAVGNRTAYNLTTPLDGTAVTTYTYDAANRLLVAGAPGHSVAYTWDARGNLLADGTFTYTYSAAGRMVQAQNLTATLVYTYNADGLRVARSQSVSSVQSVDTFTWDWATPVPELLSDGESLYLIGYDTLGWQNGADWTFVLPDALGSVRQETDATGAVTAVREWSPYGVEVGTAQAGVGYTGEWWDNAVRLQYLRARWLDSNTGRFTSRDPIESEPPYQYVRGNPVNFTDPSGRYAGYCYNFDEKRLTLSSDQRTPCAPDASPVADVDAVLRRYHELQSRGPRPLQTTWVELDQAWGFSAYPALDLAQYPPSEEQYSVFDWETSDNVLLPRNWIENPSDPASSVQMQGSGRLPPNYYGGRTVRWNNGAPEITDQHIRGGRIGRFIEDLTYRAVAAPLEFPNQALLYVPGLEVVNPSGLLSVEDSGGEINYTGGRIDVFVGVMTAYEAVVVSGRWGGWEARQPVFVLVDLPQPTWMRSLPPQPGNGVFPFPSLWGIMGECYLPETIEGVNIRPSAGAVLQ